MKRNEPLLSAKEFAQRLGRTVEYVYAAKRKGMPHVSGRFPLDSSLSWLQRNPYPRQKKR